jgi:hypothetical protein
MVVMLYCAVSVLLCGADECFEHATVKRHKKPAIVTRIGRHFMSIMIVIGEVLKVNAKIPPLRIFGRVGNTIAITLIASDRPGSIPDGVIMYKNKKLFGKGDIAYCCIPIRRVGGVGGNGPGKVLPHSGCRPPHRLKDRRGKPPCSNTGIGVVCIQGKPQSNRRVGILIHYYKWVARLGRGVILKVTEGEPRVREVVALGDSAYGKVDARRILPRGHGLVDHQAVGKYIAHRVRGRRLGSFDLNDQYLSELRAVVIIGTGRSATIFLTIIK